MGNKEKRNVGGEEWRRRRGKEEKGKRGGEEGRRINEGKGKRGGEEGSCVNSTTLSCVPHYFRETKVREPLSKNHLKLTSN
jgi:hypothetical protein